MATANFSWAIPSTGETQTGSSGPASTIPLNDDWLLAVGFIRPSGSVLTKIVPAGTPDPWALDPATYPHVLLTSAAPTRSTPDNGVLTLESVS